MSVLVSFWTGSQRKQAPQIEFWCYSSSTPPLLQLLFLLSPLFWGKDPTHWCLKCSYQQLWIICHQNKLRAFATSQSGTASMGISRQGQICLAVPDNKIDGNSSQWERSDSSRGEAFWIYHPEQFCWSNLQQCCRQKWFVILHCCTSMRMKILYTTLTQIQIKPFAIGSLISCPGPALGTS